MFFICHADAQLVLYDVYIETAGRPKHSEDALSNCKAWMILDTPLPLSKSYLSGVQSQNISFTVTSSWSWNSINSSVPHKKSLN